MFKKFLKLVRKNEKVFEHKIINYDNFIKDAKIKRGLSIKAIDIYTNEEQIFNTHKECSKKLKVKELYIKENLKFGHTDYMGDAIMYLSENLGLEKIDYLNDNISPIEIYSMLNDKIFEQNISDEKREEILSSDKLEPLKMHYKFECIDKEYDDYFLKYKSIIQEDKNDNIELIDKNKEIINIFKSLDECATYLNKDKTEISNRLKYGQNKIGKYEIRYSLKRI